MGPCSVHWIHSGCVVVLTLCNLFSDAPFSHVFSSESSSIDIVRLGQSCQRLFFNQKPALSLAFLHFWTYQPQSSFLCPVLYFEISSDQFIMSRRDCFTSCGEDGACSVMKALCKDIFLRRQQNWDSEYCPSFYTSFRRHCSVVAHGTPVRRFVLWPQWWPCYYATHSAHERCQRRQVSAWL